MTPFDAKSDGVINDHLEGLGFAVRLGPAFEGRKAGSGVDLTPDALFDLVVEMGGSISAEHGIGVAKRAAFERTCPPADLAAMRALKVALDPNSILNPGVLFP